jgi:hypothetical protein
MRRSNRIIRWLERAGVTDSKTRVTVAIDLSDAIDAMEDVQRHLEALLRSAPETKAGNDRALTHAAGLGVLWSDELKFHVDRLHRNWERRVESVIARRIRRSRTRTAA